ncbi:MAG: DNA polymerase III [Candidatus Nealsonbacteria bacterium CG_4_9_14_3_um_filter_35_11]|uniref:DNA polymerase beta n=2 Tax=Candidatus Nealsoniibacteriota TaxID=1817911 RepID=A0A2M7DAG4_9BACT|nr:MAG: DNA polymerase III [Candidatus Nealsonbacteria bacterium CG11_big_fil_rev_8_21_14_0_20_35_11]PIV45465.1 MAG: DNA polymerase III [Candidatus Nealsonbacteria bacterium CG02_land_8_20_14_3_00_34_20]PIW92469.1 MAG: DNA polymerase III [Candidatus Nealsonbacteria bacterium CG_4_8_14_3_um_filter_34_13]PIZ89746.1 MAG: DNA polymerase III [Candidatus Nealsonbacteria bacterium CG_4_10_14_0_2_um_filter_35_20]PJA84812.1 MAG: DNA polymerase III [Candidatus Nealsonbacteria bacterium CG_4_9_14_3_um_fil
MKNQEIANIFYEIGDFLEMEGVQFKPYAYKKAAITLDALEEDVGEIYKQGGKKVLEKIPGIGESMAEKIEEYLKTGKIRYYEDLKKKTPINIEELTAVEGLGPKRVKVLYQEIGIRNLKDLERAAREHKISPLFGFDVKTEKNILEGIKFLKRSKGKFLLGDILPIAEEIEKKLKSLKEVNQVSVCGSVRRKKETIGDVDFLVISKKPEKVMDFFVSLPGVIKIWGKGSTKASVRMREGFDTDIRVVPKKSYGSALQYFTGSKEHNIKLRKIAIEKNLKLSEYGLFKGRKMIAGNNEEEIYKSLGMKWIEPELREDRGEIEADIKGQLPKIVDYDDIEGDLHCHSNWDGGANSIEEIAEVAIKMGYQYLGISDHTKFLRIEHGLNENQLAEQRKEIDKINKQLAIGNKQLKVLQGCEANILNDGSIDIKDEALKKLDFVIAGIHSNFKMEKEKMTERIIQAMKNPSVDIIAHPTGRILKRRDEYECDFNKILRTAKETGTVLEINSFPERLDLNDQNIRKAKEVGVKMVINTDSHHKDQLRLIEFGIAQARRGWAEKDDIINTQPLEKLLKIFKK